MASERKSADAFETALKRELQRVPSVNGADCPAPDGLAAYYDRALARSERARVDTHLLSCGRCQSMIAAIARADDSERSQELEPARWLFWVTRLVAPVAVIGVVIAIAIGMRTREQQAPEVIALASPVAEMKPQSAQPAPAPPPQALPQRFAPSVAQPANPPAVMTLGKPHHKVGARGKAAAISPKSEELTHEEIATAETASAPSEYPSSAPPAESSSAPASAPGATLEAPSAPPIEGENATLSEVPVTGGAIPSVAGAAASAPALQTSTRMAQAQSAMRSEAPAAGAAVSGSGAGFIIVHPHVYSAASPDGSVVWSFGSQGVIFLSENSAPPRIVRQTRRELLAASAPSNDVCWIVGKSGAIMRTLDRGAHWQIVKPPSDTDFTGVIATDSNNATVVALYRHSYVTHDGGVTWSSP